jgi:hypothetical protein
MEFMRVLSRRAGAEMGIPTLISKEFEGRSRVKAAIIRLRAIIRLEARRARE